MRYVDTNRISYGEFAGLLENPVQSDAFYRGQMKLLQKYHKFTFRPRKKFTPAQKSAITRAWNRYARFVSSDRKGREWTVKTTTRKSRRELSSRYVMSSRGMIVPKAEGGVRVLNGRAAERFIKGIEKKRFKVATLDTADAHLLAVEFIRVNGPLWRRSLVVSTHRGMIDIFFPLLSGETIDRLANAILVYLRPVSIHLSVNTSAGTTPYDPDSWAGYRESLMYLDKKLRDNDADSESPFTGIHASFFTHTVRKRR